MNDLHTEILEALKPIFRQYQSVNLSPRRKLMIVRHVAEQIVKK
jgi:hypothetical protein